MKSCNTRKRITNTSLKKSRRLKRKTLRKLFKVVGGNDNDKPLFLAIYKNNLDNIKTLIKEGANVNETDEDRYTPLHIACQEGNLDIIKYLIKKGAKVNAKTNYGSTPLHIFCQEGIVNSNEVNEENITKYLDVFMNKGAIIDIEDNDGRTPLEFLIEKPSSTVHKYLAIEFVKRGAKINNKTSDGHTLLLLVLKKIPINSELIHILIEKGADLNVKDEEGRTPLHLMVNYFDRQPMLAEKMVEYGANVTAKDKDGLTPIDVIVNMIENNKDFATAVHINPTFEYGRVSQIVSGALAEKSTKRSKKVDSSIIYKMLSTIDYIDDSGVKYKVPIMTIPKGALLFRSVSKPVNKQNDYCGIRFPMDPHPTFGAAYCLNKNHNVFFYPYPGYSFGASDAKGNLTMFVVKEDMKLLNLTYPSPLGRDSRGDILPYYKLCRNIEKGSCRGYINGSNEDPCFTKHFIETHPDIVGSFSISWTDYTSHLPTYKNAYDYSVLSHDGSKIGLPEVILYPHKERIVEDKLWYESECLSDENKGLKNYEEVFTKPWIEDMAYPLLMRNKNKFKNAFNKYLDPKGYKGQHITIFSPLKLFVMWEELPEKYKSDCVPLILDVKSKLMSFQSDINNLNKDLHDKYVTIKELII